MRGGHSRLTYAVRVLRRVGCSLLAGLAIWLAFPTHDLWPAAVLGVALLAGATCGVRPARGFLLGLIAGWACFVPLLSWSGVYVGHLPWFALGTLEALYIAALGLVCAWLQRPRGDAPARIRPLAVALAWVGSEFARSTTPFGGFPWGRLAFSQADGPFANLAALGGAPAVTFGVALVGALFAAACLRLVRRRRTVHANAGESPRPRRTRVLDALALPAIVALAASPMLVPLPVDGPNTQVMAIQGNVPQAGLEFNAQRRAVLDNHARVTQEAAREVAAGRLAHPDLVLWPENASDIDPLRNPDASRIIEAAVSAVAAPVVVGAVLEEPVGFVSNASLLYEPGTGIVDRYVKQRPVPFAEYIPYRSFFRHFSDKVDLVTRDFAAGDRTGVFRVPRAGGGTVAAGLNICFEVAIDDVVRAGVLDGADLITVQTNNATFGFTDESEQQLEISRLRAIEHGRSVVHISNVGVSALITPDGTMHQQTALFTPAILSGALPLREEQTLATRIGPWPEWIASAALVLLVLAGGTRPRIRSGARR